MLAWSLTLTHSEPDTRDAVKVVLLVLGLSRSHPGLHTTEATMFLGQHEVNSLFVIEDSCKNGPLPCVLVEMKSSLSLIEGSLHVKWQSHVLAQCLILTL